MAVRPIRDGKIVNLDAFLSFIKLIYKSILNEKSRAGSNADVFDSELSNIPMLLISNSSWSQFQQERITQFIFEELQINNFMFLPSALATSYALGSLQNCVVIDIGSQSTEVIPILDYAQLTYLITRIPSGGDCINEQLKKLLPQWTEEQVEDLKKSAIFEVLSEDAKQNSAFDFQADDEEGNLDIAALVTSDRDTREILEEREREKEKNNVRNSELENNTFVDRTGKTIIVGKQRFQGCELLITRISIAVGQALSQIDDLHKLRAIWENILVVGGTTSIIGFKEALLNRLCEDHLIQEPAGEKQAREEEMLSQMSNKKKTKISGAPFLSSIDYVQAPTVIKLAKYPEYFPEWKKHGYAEIPFLGAQIVTKQVFGHSNENFYVTREKYEKKGPAAIWDVAF